MLINQAFSPRRGLYFIYIYACSSCDFFLLKEIGTLLSECLPHPLKDASIEMSPYLLDSFGNSTRIDYGSGNVYCLFVLDLYTNIGKSFRS